MNITRRINHINVTAPPGHEKEARWFYETLLGLKEIPFCKQLADPYELLWFQLCDILLHVAFEHQYRRPLISFEKGVIMPGPHIGLEIKNIATVRKMLEENKITTYDAVILEDRDRFYGLDPFGNCIEFIEFHKDQQN